MSWVRIGWVVAFGVVAGVRLWNGFTGPMLRGYDDHGHVGYVLYLDLYRAIPWADQGWSYFHPPLHYLFGWLLAQLRSAEALLHGLALLNGLSSLAIAWIASRVVRLAIPDRADLSLVAFVSVGLLPVYLYTSTMAGNEITAAFFGTAAFALLVSNECREEPSIRVDALVGLLFGLALLSKVSAALTLAAAGLVLGLRLLRTRELGRIVVRGVVVAGIALVVASPYYVRNVVEFGSPFKMSRDNPHVVRLESQQPPGSRTWRDFVYVPLATLSDPNPRSEHLLHSVWGSAYAQTWADTRLSWETLPEEHQPHLASLRSWMAILGLGPTFWVVLGAGLALVDVARGRRRAVTLPRFCLAGVSLASFVYFAIAAPQFSALKASYLLGLTLPFAVFLARGLEGVGDGSRGLWRALAAMVVVVPAGASAWVHADGLAAPRLGDHKAVAALAFYFEDYEVARSLYERRTSALLGQPPRQDLASIALVQGDPYTARSLLELMPRKSGKLPFRWNALGVSAALGGDLAMARGYLDEAVDAGGEEVALTNRGVVRALQGDLEGAESDLRAALEHDDALAPAWQGLAKVLAREGREADAQEARQAAVAAAVRAPRRHPYGIPDGLGQYPSFSLKLRFLLWLRDGELLLARAPFTDGYAVAMRPASDLLADRPHVVLIVIDTLRADHLGVYGYPRPTSPHIDRLAREGVRFANVQATSSWTLPSAASLFTSLPPGLHKATSWGRALAKGVTTFVERLDAAGYDTLGVSGNFVHVTEKNRFDRGFARWQTLSFELGEDEGEALLEKKGVRYREPTAQEVNEVVLDLLPERPGPHPLFLYVHYMDPHSAYDPPPDKRRDFARRERDAERDDPVTSAQLAELVRGEAKASRAEQGRMIDLYDAEIATVDEEIGALLGELERRGFAEKLVVAVVADHGEAFGEHDSWFHGLNLHRESLQVPLVLWDSREPRREEVVETPVDLLDVPTTLLSLAGVQRSVGMFGRDLLSARPGPDRPLMASLGRDRLFEGHLRPREHRKAVTWWPWKIIVDSSWVPRLYDLENDPRELRPIALDDPRVPPELRSRAIQLARRDPPKNERGNKKRGKKRAKKKRAGPTEEERAQLRALGYAE